MSSAPIYFQFPDKRSALLAMDTLHEIGFQSDLLEQRHPDHTPTLEVHVEKGDLTSALEIAQSHGGRLCDTEETHEPDVYTNAYGLDGIPIPAHTVTEDLPESYMSGAMPEEWYRSAMERDFDPSGEDYDHFSAGVRL